MPEVNKLLWKVQSESSPTRYYSVTFNGGGFKCTCPDFVYRHKESDFKNETCKHIDKVMSGRGGAFYKTLTKSCDVCATDLTDTTPYAVLLTKSGKKKFLCDQCGLAMELAIEF